MKPMRSHIDRIEKRAACRLTGAATFAAAGFPGLLTLRVISVGLPTVGTATHTTCTTTGTPVGVL